MLPSYLSTMNTFLTVAVVALFIVFITLLMKLNPSTKTKETPETEIKVDRQKPVAPAKTESSHPKKDCPHHMGYLSTLTKNTPIPDECFGCKKIVVCFLNVKGQREDDTQEARFSEKSESNEKVF